jgi:endonuclease/exonuclease/phosphatase family metal-dependent hydrolase
MWRKIMARHIKKVIIFFLLAWGSILIAIPLHSEEVKVVTINVWAGLDYEGTLKMGEYEQRDVWKKRYQILVEELRALDPDIIAINEGNELPRYARRLARDLEMDFVYAVGMGGIKIGCAGIPTNFREGDAILAKKDLHMKSLGKKRLSGGGIITNFFTFHFTEANQVVGGIITFGTKAVYIFNTHTHASPPNEPWFMERLNALSAQGFLTPEELETAKEKVREDQKWRRDEIEKLLLWIDETVPPDAPIILMGDFNAEAETEEMKLVFDAGFTDTYGVKNPEGTGYTWDPETNRNIQTYYESDITDDLSPEKIADRADDFIQKRIDFIFIGGSIEPDDVRESRVVLDRVIDGQHPSDHFGVMSVIRIK